MKNDDQEKHLSVNRAADAPGADPRRAYADVWKPARFGLLAVGGFVVLLALWSGIAPLSGAAIADGSFQVEGRRQSVQHPYGGVVQSLQVREGETVEEGEILIRLSASEPQSRYDVLKARHAAALARKARLIAEREGADEPDFSVLPAGDGADNRQIILNERALMEARARQHEANLALVEQKIVQLEEQQKGVRAEIEGLERQAELIEEEAAGARKLLADGYTPRTRVLELERNASAAQAELGAKRAELAAIGEAVGEARIETAKLERERLREITAELQAVEAELAEIGPNLEAAADVLRRTEIVAPASGRVVGLTVFTEGGVIEPGARLLDIVPGANPLFVEARLKLSDIADVSRGQGADVRLVGVPRNVRPKLSGTISNVSADAIVDERTGAEYYAIQVALDRSKVADAGMVLQPGMPVQVIVETEPRTLIGYLTSPLMDEVTGAFRER